MPTPTKAETQARLTKEKNERDAKTARLKAERLAEEVKKKKGELDQHAKRVSALYKSMREFEAQAEAKAGFELKKANQKKAALEKALLEARVLCKAAGEDFKAFQEKFAPDYKRTQLYQILAIADGRKTVEEVREGARDRKRKQRAGQSSVTEGDVTDSAAEGEAKPAPVTGSVERPLDQVRAASAALADEADTKDDRSSDAVAKSCSRAADDSALSSFSARALELVRMTKNREPARYAKTAVSAADLNTLGQFLMDLARLATPKTVH
jgi:uncharacterized protein YoxC